MSEEDVVNVVKSSIHPVFKRFFKGLGACIIAFLIKFALDNVGLIVPIEWVPIFTALVLAIEKALPKNW